MERESAYSYEHIIPAKYFQFKLFPFRGKDGWNYRVRKRWHQWIEIFYVEEGSLEFYINSTKYVLEARERALFYELIYLMMTEFSGAQQDKGVMKLWYRLEQMSDIIGYIEQHYAEEITLEGIAQEFNFFPSYLSRMFQKYAKMNYKTYLLDLRPENGCRELINTNASIGTIAVNHGFPNGKAFSKAFKKRYGCLPSEYRKRMKG